MNQQISDFRFSICFLMVEMFYIIEILFFFNNKSPNLSWKIVSFELKVAVIVLVIIQIIFSLMLFSFFFTIVYMLKVAGDKSVWGEKKKKLRFATKFI